MFNKDDILARLHDGDSVDDIATEMAAALNAAKTAYDEAEAKRIEEEKRIAEAKAKADQEKVEKRVAVQRIVDAFANYAELFGKQEYADKLDAMSDDELDEIVEAMDAMIELVEMADKLKVLEYGMPKSILVGDKAKSLNNMFKPVGVEKLPKCVQQVPNRTPDDIISEFLKTL